MKMTLKPISGSIVAPKGFRAAGVFCDIKRLGTGKGSDKGQKREYAQAERSPGPAIGSHACTPLN